MSNAIVKVFSPVVRQHVVSEIEAGRMSVAEARRRFGIGGSNTIYQWLGKYGKSRRTATQVYVTMKNETDPIAQRDEQIKRLKKEKAELESALAQKEVKLMLAESLVSQAEKYVGMKPGDLKKNFGPKA
jgi:transposase-like protein